MTIEQIEKFIEQQLKGSTQQVKISFKTRNQVNGIFLHTPDYDELKRKNLWRIVTAAHLDNYQQTNDLSHARMFSGGDFTKLSLQ